MYNDEEEMSTDDKRLTHGLMNFCMIIAIIRCDVVLILKSYPGWMELDIGSFILLTQLSNK